MSGLAQGNPLSGKCLNAGCGEGLYCSFLEGFPEVTEIVNVDLAGAAERGKRLTDPRHRSLDASLTDLPFADGSFDELLMYGSSGTHSRRRPGGRRTGRCVRPGGRLLVSVPHPPAPFDPNHVREGYTLDDMTTLLGRHDFRVTASARCFSGWMASLLSVWRWQHQWLGRGRRNLMPRAAVRLFGYADRHLPYGHRWDLAVMAVRQ